MNNVTVWVRQHLSNPQIVSLLLVLGAFWGLLTFATQVFAPLFAAAVVAYLLDAPVHALEKAGLGRTASASIVWAVAAVLVALMIALLVPQVLRQGAQVATELPKMTADLQRWLASLAARNPEMLSEDQAQALASGLSIDLYAIRQAILAKSHLLGVGLTYVVVYLVLVPLVVFFLLKDKDRIKTWFRGFMPADIGLIASVWADLDKQLGNYVRGKVMEILIVGTVAIATFSVIGLNYAILLGVATGVSVLVPWVGATLVTLPVAAVAYSQFGVGPGLATTLIAYAVLQALDGNVLVPILFSETNDLHPVAIIVAVLFFGLTYGVWGAFFAIPLATLVAAVIRAWPRAPSPQTKAVEAGPEASA